MGHDNLRKYYRLNVDIPIKFCMCRKGEQLNETSHCFEARTRDISLGGLQIQLDRLIEELFLIDSFARVEIHLPDPDIKVSVDAIPKKIHGAEEETGVHPIRLEFTDLSPEQVQILKEFIEKHKTE